MFAVGETHRRLDGTPNEVTGVWKIRSANQSQGIAYYASGHVVQVRTRRPQKGTVTVSNQQAWTEVVTCGADVKARSGTAMTAARKG
jgi:hypothetical protein